ncbi:MAG: hypothetical protein ACFFC7_00325 [Candidatus Hermodarchaeota archaeon]
MTSNFQKLSDTLEGLISEKKGIFGSILFDPHGQVVLCTQNILTGELQLKNQTFDATDIGYVSTAISEKIKNSPESSSSELFDDIFYLDEENALLTKTIRKTGYNFMIVAKKDLKSDQKLRIIVEKIVSDLEEFILGF